MTKKVLTREEIIQEIQKYSPHTERITLSTLMAINQKIHILNIGPSGIGKTRSTVELLQLIKIPHNLISGHCSPKAFFEILQDDGIIIVDEGADLLSNATVQNLLLNALWNGKVEWITHKGTLTHDFKGIIIFNTNAVLGRNELVKALKDRIFTNEVNLTSEEIKDKILSRRAYKPNMKIWAEIKEKLDKKTELSELTKGKVYTLIKNKEPKSTRDFWKLHTVFSFSLSLTNDLSIIEFFEGIDEEWKILNSNIKRSEKVKKIAELKCITERGARKIVEKFENGKV